MQKREAQRIVRRHGRRVTFHWQGDDLIRSCWAARIGASRTEVVGNCYDCTRRQAELAAWIREAASCQDEDDA